MTPSEPSSTKTDDLFGDVAPSEETEGLEVFHFTIGASALGRVLVATSEKGVSAVLLGSKEKSLIADLQGRNSRAVLIEGGDVVERALTAVMRNKPKFLKFGI